MDAVYHAVHVEHWHGTIDTGMLGKMRRAALDAARRAVKDATRVGGKAESGNRDSPRSEYQGYSTLESAVGAVGSVVAFVLGVAVYIVIFLR